MKIYGTDHVNDAVKAVVVHGVAAVEGTKIPAESYANRIIQCLSTYQNIEPSIGYQNVSNNGCLYYVCDLSRFAIGSQELKKLIAQIDDANP